MNVAARAALAFVLLFASCASDGAGLGAASVVGAGALPSALRGVSTVSLHPRARLVRPRPGESEDAIRRVTERALVDAFTARGYRVVAEGGQRELAYAVGVSDTLGDAELVQLFGIAPGLDSRDGHRGGLVLVLWDPFIRDVVWRRSASADVPGRSGGEAARRERIEAGVELLLADLPPSGPR